jgi:hypothetical protein
MRLAVDYNDFWEVSCQRLGGNFYALRPIKEDEDARGWTGSLQPRLPLHAPTSHLIF